MRLSAYPSFPMPRCRRRSATGPGRTRATRRPKNDDENAGQRFRPVAPGEEFLFDRRVDPGENVNLVARESAEAKRMRDLLERHLSEEGTGVVERGVRIDPGIADRLRAMGYLR